MVHGWWDGFLMPIVDVPTATVPVFYVTSFSDNFDSAKTITDLRPLDYSRWTGFELLPSRLQPVNHIGIGIDTATGSRYLDCQAIASVAGALSKMELKKQNMAWSEGMTIHVAAKFFIVGTAAHDALTVLDIEGQPDSLGEPGIRLMFVGGSGQRVVVERSKFGESTIQQTNPVDFPRDVWVSLIWEILLSRTANGWTKLWQDGVLVLQATGVQTMPPASITTANYDDLQVGVTANSFQSDVRLYVDNVQAYN